MGPHPVHPCFRMRSTSTTAQSQRRSLSAPQICCRTGHTGIRAPPLETSLPAVLTPHSITLSCRLAMSPMASQGCTVDHSPQPESGSSPAGCPERQGVDREEPTSAKSPYGSADGFDEDKGNRVAGAVAKRCQPKPILYNDGAWRGGTNRLLQNLPETRGQVV